MWTACFDGLPPRALWEKPCLFKEASAGHFSLPPPHLIPNVISLCCHLSPFREQHEQLFPPGHSLVTDPARQHCLIVSPSVSDGGKNCFLWSEAVWDLQKGVGSAFPQRWGMPVQISLVFLWLLTRQQRTAPVHFSQQEVLTPDAPCYQRTVVLDFLLQLKKMKAKNNEGRLLSAFRF